MVDYGKSKAVKKGTIDYGKLHKQSITGLMEQQFFNSISPQNNPHLNKYHKGDYQTGKRVINLNNNGSLRCNHQRSSHGVC